MRQDGGIGRLSLLLIDKKPGCDKQHYIIIQIQTVSIQMTKHEDVETSKLACMTQ